MNRTFKLITSFIMATLVTACACSSCAPAPNLEETMPKDQADFYGSIQSMCGKTFTGTTVYPDDPDHDFAGKKLTATIDDCHHRIIRIPFTVGNDESRTWILLATYQGLLFKHDHRYPDGKAHDITNYGGYAGSYKNEAGTSTKQFFLADEETAEMLPEAATNVWMLEYKAETKELIYYLERHGKPRYKAVLKEI